MHKKFGYINFMLNVFMTPTLIKRDFHVRVFFKIFITGKIF